MALTATALVLALLSLAWVVRYGAADPVVVRAAAAAPAPDGYWSLNCATLVASPSARYAALTIAGADACGLSDGVFFGGNVLWGNDSIASLVSQCWLFVAPTLFIPPGPTPPLQPPPAVPVPQAPRNPSTPQPLPAPTQASRIPMAPPTLYAPHQLSFVSSSSSGVRPNTVGAMVSVGAVLVLGMLAF